MRNYKAKVTYDEFAENPLNWTDTKILKQASEPPGQFDTIMPIYKYEHSGVKFSTSPFNNRWDSGQIGWIVSNTYDRETLKSFVENEYTQWANGQIYHIKVFETKTCECCGNEELIEVDSLSGIYDDDFEQTIKELMGYNDIEQ